MTRIATVALQTTMSDAIQRTQQRLADVQRQLATGKTAPDLASLGSETTRHLSARSLVSRQEAEAAVAQRVGTTLSLYDAHLTAIDDTATELRAKIFEAIGTGQSSGLAGSIEGAFDLVRASLNASEGGVPLFGGGQSDTAPFRPGSLSDTVGVPAADAFANGQIRTSARVSDGLDLPFGQLADAVGARLFEAFRTLAEAGPIGETPDAAQTSALQAAITQIDDALQDVRGANAANGLRQSRLESLSARSEERLNVLRGVISENEDADLAEVAIELAQQQARLEASYSVFSRLSRLSLSDYLR